MTRSRGRLALLLVLVALLVVGCAAGPNVAATGSGEEAGFWLGLWQGFITPVTFVISLFTDNVNIYEVNNNGNWYDFGYVLGLSVAFGGTAGSGSAAGRRARRRT
jgi:hypothetical protein